MLSHLDLAQQKETILAFFEKLAYKTDEIIHMDFSTIAETIQSFDKDMEEFLYQILKQDIGANEV